MDAVEYLKARAKMTKDCEISCCKCPFFSTNNINEVGCIVLENEYAEEAVRIVENWNKEHRKTYKQDFLDKFPNAITDTEGLPDTCRRTVYGIECAPDKCCADCWNEPMEVDDDEH